MSYVLLITMVGAAIVLLLAISALRSMLNKKFDSVDTKFDSLNEKVEKLQQFTEDFEYRTLTPQEKAFRRFQGTRSLTLAEVEHFKEGQTLHLISCSYIYPSSEPEVVVFDYKHRLLGEGSTVVGGKTYVSATGSWQLDGDDRWSHYTFYAGVDACHTNTFEGEIRRLY